MEIVLVELANKTGKIAVLEVLGQDGFCEFLALQGKVDVISIFYIFLYFLCRVLLVGHTSNTTKLSFSSPQRTISE